MSKVQTIVSLNESVDIERMYEVCVCKNLPIKKSSEYRVNTKDYLDYLSRALKGGEEGVKIEYVHKNKKNNYGRLYSTSRSIQFFPKEVRSYVCGERYVDVDIENCHPTLLLNVFRNNNMPCDFLEQYVNDRNDIISRIPVLKGKNDLIMTINNSRLMNKYKGTSVEFFHIMLYQWFEEHIYKNNKAIFNEFKNKNPENAMGSCIAWFLQNMENTVLSSIRNYFDNNGVLVDVLMFDGCMIKNEYNIDEKMLRECEQYVKDDIDINIKLKFKSTSTEWRPEYNKEDLDKLKDELNNEDNLSNLPVNIQKKLEDRNKIPEFNDYFDQDVAEHLLERIYDLNPSFSDEGLFIRLEQDPKPNKKKVKEYCEYMNRYVCVVNKPFCYGFRDNINKNFDPSWDKSKLNSLLGAVHVDWSLAVRYVIDWWAMQYNYMKRYYKYDSIIYEHDMDYNNPDILNLYQRPKYVIKENTEETCKKVFDFIKEVICDNNEELYKFIIQFISNMIVFGKTEVNLYLLGEMGTGKSTFTNLLWKLVGKEYGMVLNDPNRLTGQFNSHLVGKVLVILEEIENDQGSKHSFNSQKKSITTEKDMTVEAKFKDACNMRNNTNLVFCTNHYNPTYVDEYDRREVITQVSNKHRQDSKYFAELNKCIEENIEELRGYFYSKGYDPTLRFRIPNTIAREHLKVLSKPINERFIEEEIIKRLKDPTALIQCDCSDEEECTACKESKYETHIAFEKGRTGIKLNCNQVYNAFIRYARDNGDQTKQRSLFFENVIKMKYGAEIKKMKFHGNVIKCILFPFN